jgi:hypothetical protein
VSFFEMKVTMHNGGDPVEAPSDFDWTLIRKMRERTKQSVEHLAIALKMSQKRLIAIEEGAEPRWAELEQLNQLYPHIESDATYLWGGVTGRGETQHFILWDAIGMKVKSEGFVFVDGQVALRDVVPLGSLDSKRVQIIDSMTDMRVYVGALGAQVKVLYLGEYRRVSSPFTDKEGNPFVYRTNRDDSVAEMSDIETTFKGGTTTARGWLHRMPRWGGYDSIRVTVAGDEYMAEGGVCDFDYAQCRVVGKTEL